MAVGNREKLEINRRYLSSAISGAINCSVATVELSVKKRAAGGRVREREKKQIVAAWPIPGIAFIKHNRIRIAYGKTSRSPWASLTLLAIAEWARSGD